MQKLPVEKKLTFLTFFFYINCVKQMLQVNLVDKVSSQENFQILNKLESLYLHENLYFPFFEVGVQGWGKGFSAFVFFFFNSIDQQAQARCMEGKQTPNLELNS